MTTLRAAAVSHAFGPTSVLDGIDLIAAPGHRIGVVGPNGTGKSTLLRILAGDLIAESGTRSLAPPTATVGLLPQEPERRDDETVAGFVARRTGVAEADHELAAAADAMAAGTPDSDDRYSAALDRWLALGAPDLDARLGTTLVELGIDPLIAAQPTASLSGGQAARVSLAAIVLSLFDVLLLDEPTNDLDFDGLARLEDFLLDRAGATVVVSHDRAFLERVVTHVLDLDEHAHTGRLYAGGWSAYLEDRRTQQRHAQVDYATYRTKRAELTDRARTQREWSTQGVAKAKRSGETDKNIRFKNTADSEKVAHKAKATERAMERLDVVDKPWESWELRFEIGAAARSGDVVSTLQGAEVSRGSFHLGPVDLEIGWADRVAIRGPNGAGKSTLLDVILGRLALTSGEASLGPGVVVGELSQRRDRFATDQPLFDVVTAATGQPANEVRSLLAKFGLGADQVSRPSASLSPGQRTRANLALFMASGVNCLVLDEPTNHLDVEAIEQLEQALDRYVGTLLVVTHDRRFAEQVHTTRVIDVTNGQVREVR